MTPSISRSNSLVSNTGSSTIQDSQKSCSFSGRILNLLNPKHLYDVLKKEINRLSTVVQREYRLLRAENAIIKDFIKDLSKEKERSDGFVQRYADAMTEKQNAIKANKKARNADIKQTVKQATADIKKAFIDEKTTTAGIRQEFKDKLAKTNQAIFESLNKQASNIFTNKEPSVNNGSGQRDLAGPNDETLASTSNSPLPMGTVDDSTRF